MYDIISYIFTGLLIFGFSMFAYESCRMVDEKKQRQRKGLTDYYDNPIKKNKCMGGEDE